MDGGSFTLRWEEDPRVQSDGVIAEEVICAIENQAQHYGVIEDQTSHLTAEQIIADTDQTAAENLISFAQDIVGSYNHAYGVGEGDGGQYRGDSFTVEAVELDNEVECQVTEEVITDDWVQPGGQERVEVPMDQLALVTVEQQNEENDIDVPLPTDQDEYTAMRPYPCDFCSRRFRKKANLMNHMVAHQNDRPFGCNLCGLRYVRRCDLLNHLKVHAFVPDPDDNNDYDTIIPDPIPTKRKSRRRSPQSSENGGSFSYALDMETSVAARTQQYAAPGSAAAGGGTSSTGGNSSASAAPTLAPVRVKFEMTNPRKPFVCQHCGVGFAREKALASHARIHGGDSPLECKVCGELCWSREQLASHSRAKHPHRPAQAVSPVNETLSDSSVNDEVTTASRGAELFCSDCGAGFQRADLLRRHIRAAHSYKLEPQDIGDEVEDADADGEGDLLGLGSEEEAEDRDPWGTQPAQLSQHSCSVCGDSFRDALDLLAHAESHARSRNNRCMQCGEKFSDAAQVSAHVSSAHGPLPPHTCQLCGRACRDRRSLQKHSATCHDAPAHTLFCSKCGKSFHNKARLKRHMASHRDKAVVCNVCGERFTDGRSLMNHRHSHAGVASRQFPCRECGKTFGSRSSQQIHIRIHTGERPYACRFCWKAFADGGTLRKHERIHTGEKPYACAVCPRAFNQRVVLREHVRSHHSAPDTRRGTGSAPFCCTVCGRLMHTSVDLVQHLIQHCDANTAMKRQPQVGPRKYKRRRKLKPHELEGLSNRSEKSEQSSPEMEEPEPPVVKKRTSAKRSKKAKSPLPVDDDILEPIAQVDLVAHAKSSEPTVSGSGSARTKGKPKGKRNIEAPTRPKMIHTQKAKPSDADTPTGRRRGRAAPATLVTPRVVTPVAEERIRPRTKNVRYHVPGRPPTATFPASVKPEPDADIAADLRAILRAPLPPEPAAAPATRRERIKREPSHVEEAPSAVEVKAEHEEATAAAAVATPFRCEMCSQTFPLREQLMLHVPIHI